MRRLYGLLIVFLLCTLNVEAQNKLIYLQLVTETGELMGKSKNKFSERFTNVDIATKRLKNKIARLRQKGYWEANIDTIWQGGDTLTARIHLGNQYHIENLSVNSVDKSEFLRIDQRRIKSWDIFNSSMHDLLNKLGNKGYPFAKLEVENLNVSEDNDIQGSWIINKGQLIKWDSIEIKGPLKLKKKVLQRYLIIIPGKKYKESTTQRISNQIANLNYAREIKPSEIEFSASEAKVFTYLEKNNANQFDGIIGFQQNENKSLQLTGQIRLELVNVFRGGEEIGLKWRQIESKSQDLAVRFVYPYLFGSSIGTEWDFELKKQDSTYLATRFNFGVRLLQVGINHLKIFGERKVSSLTSTKHLKNATSLPVFADSKSVLIGLGGSWSTLDYIFNPKKGWNITLSSGMGKHEIEKNRNLNEDLYSGIDLSGRLFRGNWNLEYNQPIAPNFSLRLRTMGGFIDAPNLFDNDLLRLGGLNSLRGFDEEFFHVNYYETLSCEMRFIPEKNTSFYLFWDGAYYKRDVLNEDYSDKPWGIGFGLNFATKSGIFTLNYALGKQNDQDLDFNNAKIHFGYVTRF